MTEISTKENRTHIILDNLWVRLPEEVMIALAARLTSDGVALDYAIEKMLFAMAGYDIEDRAQLKRLGCTAGDMEVKNNSIRQNRVRPLARHLTQLDRVRPRWSSTVGGIFMAKSV